VCLVTFPEYTNVARLTSSDLFRTLGVTLRKVAAFIAVMLVVGRRAVPLFRYPLFTALSISASLAQIGESSFILAALGGSLGLLPTEAQGLIVHGRVRCGYCPRRGRVRETLMATRAFPDTTGAQPASSSDIRIRL
jgi:predicted Kef-type K+ transport protein